MAITFDPVKRNRTLRDRGIDFADTAEVFAGRHITKVDDRFDYGETRLISAGWINGRITVAVWTFRGVDRHIISARHCHAKEERQWCEAIENQA